jgi:uncharacterized protein YgbK (DUF1537 family)
MEKHNYVDKASLFDSLPASKSKVRNVELAALKLNKIDAIIVLDDDPTGTQTVHNVPVLTEWDISTLVEELENRTPLFYLLTNSRSLILDEAERLALTIGQNILQASQITNKSIWVISRGDSTLRGHYPEEVNTLIEGLGINSAVQFLIPAFFEGGRYTINNVHYVEKDEKLIPAADTVYAADHVFGFKSSNLLDWVGEKSAGSIKKDQIKAIGIKDLRESSLSKLVEKIDQLKSQEVCIVNAVDYEDLHIFSVAVLQSSIQPIFRSAASFVAAIGGITQKPLLEKKEIVQYQNKNGGLLIIGSYVDTTTRQLEHLIKHKDKLHFIECDIEDLVEENNLNVLINNIVSEIDSAIYSGKCVVFYTSRKLISAPTQKMKQKIANLVSSFISRIVYSLSKSPSFIITKGGITSSDIATKGLGVKRAMVIGQILKGVPVWKLGPETKFPGTTQIIFPGNVGNPSSLTEIIEKLE